MHSTRSQPWDMDQFRLPFESLMSQSGNTPLPRHRERESFIRGPISYAWISTACRLPGSGLHVAMTYRFLTCRYQPINRWGLPRISQGLQIHERSVQRGLVAAELASLLNVDREPGCKLAVSIIEPPTTSTAERPLYGPIPMNWWLPASRLRGPALATGAVCWLLGGWTRSAEFELNLSAWQCFGLSKSAVSRGLERLEDHGLVSVARRQGQSPVVTIRDVGREGGSAQ
jgi:DNA-binding transcriptional ArsR family regulator